jgi:hypothetical protein
MKMADIGILLACLIILSIVIIMLMIGQMHVGT